MSEESPTLEWSIHLARRRPTAAVAVVMSALLAGLLGLALLQSIAAALVGVIAVIGSTTDFLLPVHFSLGANGPRLRCGISVSSMSWNEVRKVTESADGVKLSPLAGESRLEPFRGVFLRYDGNREAVLETIRYYWKGDV